MGLLRGSCAVNSFGNPGLDLLYQEKQEESRKLGVEAEGNSTSETREKESKNSLIIRIWPLQRYPYNVKE